MDNTPHHWALGGAPSHGLGFDELLANFDSQYQVNRGTTKQSATSLPPLNSGHPRPSDQTSLPLMPGLYSGQEDPESQPGYFDRNPLMNSNPVFGGPNWTSVPTGHFTSNLPDFHRPAHQPHCSDPSYKHETQSSFQCIPGVLPPGAVLPNPAVQSIGCKEQSANRLQYLQQDARQQQLTPPLQSSSYTQRQSKVLQDDPFQDNVISSPAEQVSLRRKLPSSTAQTTDQQMQQHYDNPPSSNRLELAHAPPLASGIQLISPRGVLPDKFQSIFPYELFNAVQSKCFSSVYESNDNVVVSAPTGSGKTAILEMAICKLAADRGDDGFKIVYQAPTKALCNERSRDWETKFRHMNLKVAELTGDTSATEMRRVGEASIIVTTPEKWDSITRKWADHKRLLRMVALFLIDEVHILKDMRGATLEAVVSRMKTIGTKIRFIALSATVPNSDDIAAWLGRDSICPHLPAQREVFGEEFRPVKLRKYIYGYDHLGNDFVFDGYLDQKLPITLSKHAEQKPMLVFCFTRKSCETTAQKMAELWSSSSADNKMWPAPSRRVPVISPDLQEIVRFGVAFHHAGLDVQDRNAVEQSFTQRDLHVICCTSTLAVGVNLPCHTVVLKGTATYQDGKLSEYSDLEVMQMLGRAGRPQFDSSATAIILTRSQNKQRYERMISGQQVLESTLHLNLIEHLNSEIGLQTISDTRSAKTWLDGTFLSVRLRRNPTYYHLTEDTVRGQTIDGKLEEICTRDIKLLQESALITPGATFSATEYGGAMARYMVQFETMKKLVKIDRGTKMGNLAEEFNDLRFKPNERALYRELNKSPFILYPIKETVSSTAHKISLLVQIHLGGVEIPSGNDYNYMRRQMATEKSLAFERMQRLTRCVVDCKGYDSNAVGIRTALDLLRALTAGFWEGRPTQLLQIPNIGPVAMRKLLSGGIQSVHQLTEKSYSDIERLMSRNPPYGTKLLDSLKHFPKLTLDVNISGMGKRIGNRDNGTNVNLEATLGYSNTNGVPSWQNRNHFVTLTAESSNGMLAYFWRGSIKTLGKNGIRLSFQVELTDYEDEVFCQLSCEEIVGTIVSTTLSHGLSRSAFPAKQTTQNIRGGTKVSALASANTYDDGLSDDDLLKAVDQMSHRPTKGGSAAEEDLADEEFPHVDDFLEVATSEPKTTVTRGNQKATANEGIQRDPVQLPNGKWKCYHPCSDGGLTKSGKPCTHRCCHEGLDKPRKYKPPTKQKKSQVPVAEATDSKEVSLSRPDPTATQAHLTKKRKTNQTQNIQSGTSVRSFTPRHKERTEVEKDDIDGEGICFIDLSNVDDDFLSSPFPKPKKARTKSDFSSQSDGDANLKAKKIPSTRIQHPVDIEDYGSDPFGDSDYEDPEYLAKVSNNSHKAALTGVTRDDDMHLDGLNPEQMSPKTVKKAIRDAAALLDLEASVTNDEDEEDLTRQTRDRHVRSISGDDNWPEETDGGWESRALWLEEPNDDDIQMKEQDKTNPEASSMPEISTSVQTEVAPSRGSSGNRDHDEAPAWVGEFDEDFVKEFRGLVNFI